MKALEYRNDLESAAPPVDYRTGTLISWLLMFAGGLFAVLGMVSGTGADRVSQFYGLLVMLMIAGLLAGSGLFLTRKAKIGLWGLYFLSAWFVVDFLSELVIAIATKIVAGPPRAMEEAALLLIWFSIVGYFFKRRRLFTRLWGGASTVAAGE